MQYKVSYFLWKVKVLWPVFDFISLYFNLVLSATILSFALYSQISLLWLLYIVIYMFQTWKVHYSHTNFYEEQLNTFKNE
jgi:hypothetical protein